MQRRSWISGVAFGVVAAGAAAMLAGAMARGSQDQPDQPPQDMEMAMDADQPGPPHARLTQLAGEWSVASTFVMSDMEPMKQTANATIESIHGGRFILERSEGESLEGAEETGLTITGFNNATGAWESDWTHNLHTAMLRLTSEEDQGDADVIKMSGSFVDPASGAVETLTVTLEIADKDHFTYKLFGGGMGSEDAPVLTMVYTRK